MAVNHEGGGDVDIRHQELMAPSNLTSSSSSYATSAVLALDRLVELDAGVGSPGIVAFGRFHRFAQPHSSMNIRRA